MPTYPIKFIHHPDAKKFVRVSIGCLVLSKDGRIVLQLRDENSPTFPNRLATFGGGIEANESPLQALVRELKEELGADVKTTDAVYLGAITEAETNHQELIYLYFWHDKLDTITGCYEGKATYYNNASEAQNHPTIMEDVKWLLHECKKRQLL